MIGGTSSTRVDAGTWEDLMERDHFEEFSEVGVLQWILQKKDARSWWDLCGFWYGPQRNFVHKMRRISWLGEELPACLGVISSHHWYLNKKKFFKNYFIFRMYLRLLRYSWKLYGHFDCVRRETLMLNLTEFNKTFFSHNELLSDTFHFQQQVCLSHLCISLNKQWKLLLHHGDTMRAYRGMES